MLENLVSGLTGLREADTGVTPMPAAKREVLRSGAGGRTQGWSLHRPGFSSTLQDASGLVDFRDVTLALAALDGSRNLEELTCLAFEVPGNCEGGGARGCCAHPTWRCVWYAVPRSF